MKIFAHAKINLDLHILGKRPDGYHELSTIMQGLALADELTVEAVPADSPEILLSVSGAELPADRSNLAWKAADVMLREAARRGKSVLFSVRICLEKRIPFAAGLGGGSSDAAAVLVALNELLGLYLPTEILSSIGKRIGADVPFCILVNTGECAAAHCTGIGDFIDPVPAEERFCVLVKPALDLSTPAMYRAWDEMGTVATNDFEPIAEYRYPEIRAVKEAIRDASQIGDAPNDFNGLATHLGDPTDRSSAFQIQMSGSGPTFFALFETEEDASRVASRLEGRFPTVILTKTLAD